MARLKKIKNPLVCMVIEGESRTSEALPSVSIAPGEKIRFCVGKDKLSLSMSGQGQLLKVSDREGKYHKIRVGSSHVIPLGEKRLRVSLQSDFVKTDDGRFSNFVGHSMWMHVVAALVIAVAVALMPAKPVEQKRTSVKVDINKIKKLLKKVEQKKKKVVVKPKPKAKPKRKVVKIKPKAKPRRIVKKPRKIVQKVVRKKVRVKQRKVARRVPVKKLMRKGPTKTQLRVRAQAKAMAAKRARTRATKAKLAKQLNFLSTSKGSFSVASYKSNNNKKFVEPVSVGGKKSNVLNKMAVMDVPAGAVSTGNARTIAATGVYQGKALKGVEGKVGVKGLVGKSNLSGALSSGGSLKMSGQGNLGASIIEKILRKHQDKLRYCYEKALLSDTSLSGNIMMRWTIRTTGKVSRVKVVRSQMQNRGLHSCISRQLAGIKFPQPNGGSVDVKYPFSFSSTSI